uniref:Uncharacterized protein n=1 Tax=Anguilla anguilla TaxID=7936 RepID=A0A0E9TJX5_ANGAN
MVLASIGNRSTADSNRRVNTASYTEPQCSVSFRAAGFHYCGAVKCLAVWEDGR